MNQKDYLYNPFRLKIVDRLTPLEIDELFANPNCYSEANKIQHQFLIGVRGSGKSMLLKRLTISSFLQSQEILPFLGIYFPIKLISIEPYLKICNQTSETRTFEHYFTLNILRSLDSDLSVSEKTSDIRNQFENVVRDCLSFLPRSSSLSVDIENYFLHFGSSLSELSRQKLATITILTELLSRFSNFWQAESGTELPVALLIDNYQELGSLAFVVNNIMRKENLSTLCIKAGTTTISGLWNQEEAIEPPEYPQDFKIVVVDNDPKHTDTRKFLKEVVNKRLAEIDLTIGNVFSIFDYYAKISSGNPDCLRRLCEKAWDVAHPGTSKKPVPDPTIPEEIQIGAAKEISKEYYEGESPSKGGDFGQLLQSLVFKIVESTNSIHFTIGDKETLPLQLIELIRRGCHKGVFQIAIDERKSCEISDSFCPSDLRIHPLIIPHLNITLKKNISVDKVESKHINSSQLLDWAFAKVPGQPGFYIPGQKAPQPGLWDQWQKAFISSPLRKRRPIFISKLRKAIFEVWVSHLQQIGVSKWPPKEENFVEDCYDLRRTIKGDFQYVIDDRLAKSSFVVHDVTNLTPGVAYEIGFSRGYRKPSFMVWDITKKSFNSDLVPIIIRRGFNILHNFDYRLDSFKNDIDTCIVELALKYYGNIKCPRHWDEDCEYKEKQEKRDNIGFVYCSKIYTEVLENKLQNKMRTHGVRKPQGEELPTENEFCKYHCAICQSKIVLINYSLTDLDSAFLLGLAAGCKSYAIQLYNESERDDKKRPNQGLAMWGSKPVCPWIPDTLNFDLEKLNSYFAQKGK